MDWWPKFLNTSELGKIQENVQPTKPNTMGNILVIFVFLGGGIAIAVACMVLELCLHYSIKYKKLYILCRDMLKIGISDCFKRRNHH